MPSYALISLDTADQLKAHAATPEAQHLIKWATTDLDKAPSPLPVVHTEGTLPGQGIRDQSEFAKKDWFLMLTLSLAYRLTADARYLATSERFLSAWLAVYTVSLNPIDETNLDQMILAYDLTRSGHSPPTQEKMAQFLRSLAEGYLDKIAQKKIEDTHNWQSHRVKLITLAAYSLGDADLIARARRAFHRQVSGNIKPDGSVLDFDERDALHYVVYDLEPLTTAALAAKAHGEDWFHAVSPGGSSVARAIDWLTPYALGEKTHEEFVRSTVAFDAARAKAGIKGYSGPYPGKSIDLYQLATLADLKYTPTLGHVAAKSGRSPSAWSALLSQVGI